MTTPVTNPSSTSWIKPALVWMLIGAVIFAVSIVFATYSTTGSSTAGQDTIAWETDMAKASVRAKETGRPILVYFTADWCGPCHSVRAKIYSDPAVVKMIEENFVPVKADITKPQGPAMAMAVAFGIQGPPSWVVLDPSGKMIHRQIGARISTQWFLAWLSPFAQKS